MSVKGSWWPIGEMAQVLDHAWELAPASHAFVLFVALVTIAFVLTVRPKPSGK